MYGILFYLSEGDSSIPGQVLGELAGEHSAVRPVHLEYNNDLNFKQGLPRAGPGGPGPEAQN